MNIRYSSLNQERQPYLARGPPSACVCRASQVSSAVHTSSPPRQEKYAEACNVSGLQEYKVSDRFLTGSAVLATGSGESQNQSSIKRHFRKKVADALMEGNSQKTIAAIGQVHAAISHTYNPVQISRTQLCGLSDIDEVLRAPHGPDSGPSPIVRVSEVFSKRETRPRVAKRLAHELSGLHARIMRICFRHHRPQDAFQYAVLLPPTAKVHGTLMNEVAKHGLEEHIDAALQLRDMFRLPMDKFTLSAALSKYASEGRQERVEALYSNHCHTMVTPPDSHVFNAALSAHAPVGDESSFARVWNDMTTAGCKPTPSSYANKAKLLLEAQGTQSVLNFYTDLISKEQDPVQDFCPGRSLLSPHLFGTVFVAISRADRADPVDFNTLWSIWKDLQRFGFEPDNFLASAFLSAAKTMPLTPSQVETCYGMLVVLGRHRSKPGVGVLCNLLQICARSDTPERVLDVWRVVEDGRLRVTPHLLSAALRCCALAVARIPPPPKIREFANRLASDLSDRWLSACVSSHPTSEHNYRIAFNALLSYHASAETFRNGMETWKFMKESGPQPNRDTFNAALHVCGTCGHPSAAEALLNDMLASGISPDVRSFCCVLDACAKGRSVRRADAVLARMRSLSVPPNVYAYTSLMDACVRDGSPSAIARVPQIMSEMQQSGIQPSAASYGRALAACCARGDVKGAFAWYQGACSSGVQPTDRLHNDLIKVCVQVGRLDEAIEHIKTLIREHRQMQTPTIDSLTRALCSEYIDRALYMHRFMRHRRMTPTNRTYRALITGCATEAMPDTALSLYIDMRASGHLPATRSCSFLLTSLAAAGRVHACLLILRDMALCSSGTSYLLPPALKALQQDAEDSSAHPRASSSPRSHDPPNLTELARSLPDLQLQPPSPPPKRSRRPHGPRSRSHAPTLLRKSDMLPAIDAVSQVTSALCLNNDGWAAMALYSQVSRAGPEALSKLLRHSSRMFELLIEWACRNGRTHDALTVFDDWKLAKDEAVQAQLNAISHRNSSQTAGDDTDDEDDRYVLARGSVRPPRLSNVTLAYLEASCHAHEDRDGVHWRVYEICALMRQQQEVTHTARLPQPVKGSHHFREGR